MSRGSFVTHLTAAIDGTTLPARTLQTTHEGRPLLVAYDLDAVGRAVDHFDLAQRPRTMWRYRELLSAADEMRGAVTTLRQELGKFKLGD